MNNDSKTPDILQVSLVNMGGRFEKVQRKGAGYLTVSKGFNTPSNQIAVEVEHTSGVGAFKTKHEHQSALIHITFDDGTIWSGDFNKLRAALRPNPLAIAMQRQEMADQLVAEITERTLPGPTAHRLSEHPAKDEEGESVFVLMDCDGKRETFAIAFYSYSNRRWIICDDMLVDSFEKKHAKWFDLPGVWNDPKPKKG